MAVCMAVHWVFHCSFCLQISRFHSINFLVLQPSQIYTDSSVLLAFVISYLFFILKHV